MVKIVYTPASNILKANDMEIGQVSFHETKKVFISTYYIFTYIN